MSVAIRPLIDALQRYDAVTAEEQAVIEALPRTERTYANGADIVSEGDRPVQSCLVLEGYAIRTQVLEDGERQITAIHIAGDFVDLPSLLLKTIDHGVAALGPCRVALFPHDALRQLTDQHPHLTRLLWLSTLVDAAIHRNWIAGMGRRLAIDHLAHLVCELYTRLQSRGLVDGPSFPFPATQAELGDILGFSTVHANRTLQDLRKLGLVRWEAGRITIEDYNELAARSGFNPAYLNLQREPR